MPSPPPRISWSTRPETSDPHAVRIAGKSLRYTVELAVAAGHKLPAAVVRSFKKMQDALGLWHDMAVLAETILKLSLKHELPLHNLPLQADLLALAGRFLRQGDRQLTQFKSIWQRHRLTLPDTIRRAFPVTTESKTDPDPPDLSLFPTALESPAAGSPDIV